MTGIQTQKQAPAVILVNPQLGENIGMAARAMGNFGFSNLRLAYPRDGWPNGQAEKTAAGASWITDKATVHDDVAAAIKDLHYVYATTARPRDMTKPVLTPEQAAIDMHRRIDEGQQLGILFGRERWGLENDEVALADAVVMAPVDPQFASLNIAQAVLLIGYEWYKPIAGSLGMGTLENPASNETGLKTPGTRPAYREEFMAMFAHLERELDAAGFFKSPKMKPSMLRNIRTMLTRAEMTEQEVRTFRGLIASLTRQHLRPKSKK